MTSVPGAAAAGSISPFALTARGARLTRRPTTRCSRCCATILRLRSVREGCGIGMCGACTVLIDGTAMSAVSCWGRWPRVTRS